MNFYDIKRKWVYTAKEVPADDHYVVIEFGTRYIPADGPEYPASHDPDVKYITFPTKEEWEKDITLRVLDGKTNYIAGKMCLAKIDRQVIVTVKEGV